MSDRVLHVERMPTSLGTLTCSGRLRPDVVAQLGDPAVDLWWNLAAELQDDVLWMRDLVPCLLLGNITDYSIPRDVGLFVAQLDEVCGVLRAGGRVHVSCRGGVGRTGIGLACIRICLEHDEPKRALDLAFAVCCGPETEEQRAFVRFVGTILSERR